MIIERLKYFFCNVHNDWQIGIIRSNLKKFIFSEKVPKIEWMKCDFNVYQADPFGIEKNGNLYLFYEEFLKEKDYAVLKCKVLDAKLKQIDDRVILDDGTHKSFPYLFENEGQLYMLPESGALNGLFLYECTEFPFDWRKKSEILSFACSDAIIKKIDGVWLLLYTKANTENENENLYMRTSSNLLGNWEVELENLVNQDNYSSRNAGSIYEIDDVHYRFAQNCRNSYGENVVIKKIVETSESTFSETVTIEKSLPKNCNGFHTLNGTKSFVLVDRRKYRYQLKPLRIILKQIKNVIVKS